MHLSHQNFPGPDRMPVCFPEDNIIHTRSVSAQVDGMKLIRLSHGEGVVENTSSFTVIDGDVLEAGIGAGCSRNIIRDREPSGIRTRIDEQDIAGGIPDEDGCRS